MSSVANKGTIQERPPFDVAWQTIDGLKIRYATGGNSGERIVLFSPWPESIFAFAPVWGGLVRQFQVLAIDLPGFGRSEGRDDLFSPQTMGDFIVKAIDAFGVTSAHAIGLDVGTPSLLFASLARPELFRSLIVGAGAATSSTQCRRDAQVDDRGGAVAAFERSRGHGRVPGIIHGYTAPRFVREDYLASYEGDRLTRSAALVRAYPKDLAALAPRLASISVPVAIVVGRNDPYGLARDAAVLRERLPNARLDVLEAGHCVWEERAPEFESIVTHWVSGGFQR